jgi:hypothetical protein
MNPDYEEPMLYERLDVLLIMLHKSVDYAQNELERLRDDRCTVKRPQVDYWKAELVIRKAELVVALYCGRDDAEAVT